MSDLGWKIPVFILAGMSVLRAIAVPFWLYRDSEEGKSDLEEECKKTVASKDAELSSANLKLGRCEIGVELNCAYIYRGRRYKGRMGIRERLVPNGPIQMRMVPHYQELTGLAHLILDVTVWNDGGLPTWMRDFKLRATIQGTEYIGVFAAETGECYVDSEAIPGNPQTQERITREAIDSEITTQNPLVRGLPRQCWLHFAVRDLQPLGYSGVILRLVFKDGSGERSIDFPPVDFKYTEIHGDNE